MELTIPKLSFGKRGRSSEGVDCAVDLVALETGSVVLVIVSLAGPTVPKVELEKWSRSPIVTVPAADSLVFAVGTRLLPLRREYLQTLVFVPGLVEIDSIEVVLVVKHKIGVVAEGASAHPMSALLVLICHSTAFELLLRDLDDQSLVPGLRSETDQPQVEHVVLSLERDLVDLVQHLRSEPEFAQKLTK